MTIEKMERLVKKNDTTLLTGAAEDADFTLLRVGVTSPPMRPPVEDRILLTDQYMIQQVKRSHDLQHSTLTLTVLLGETQSDQSVGYIEP